MTLEEKDKYIADHLMPLESETLRFIVADHVSTIAERDAEIERQRAVISEIAPHVEALAKQILEGEKTISTMQAEITRLNVDMMVLADAVLKEHKNKCGKVMHSQDCHSQNYSGRVNPCSCSAIKIWCSACQLARKVKEQTE